MLTGEPDKVTVQMVAPRQLTSGDVMFAVGKLGRAAGFEPMVGRIAIAKDPTTAVFDMSTEAADQLIKFSKEQNLESIEFKMCPVLPVLQETPVGRRVLGQFLGQVPFFPPRCSTVCSRNNGAAVIRAITFRLSPQKSVLVSQQCEQQYVPNGMPSFLGGPSFLGRHGDIRHVSTAIGYVLNSSLDRGFGAESLI